MFAVKSRLLLFFPLLASGAVMITGCQSRATVEIRHQDRTRHAVSAGSASARLSTERPIGIVFRPTGGKLEMLVTSRR
jgi:hypothetical protein